MRTYYIAQGTLLDAQQCPKWKGNPEKGICDSPGYTIETNIVKQLYSIKNFK